MKRCKRAAAILLIIALSLGSLIGCGKDQPQKTLLIPESLSVCLGRAPDSLDPACAAESRDLTVISNLYENLMKLAEDETGNLTPVFATARSYEEEKHVDGSVTYTFRLRNAKWSDGASVVADDFVFAWQRLADPAVHSPNRQLMSMIKGYDEVQATGDVSKLQVSAKNSSTLVVTITGTCEWFLTDVCTAPAASPLRRAVVEATAEVTDADSSVPAPAAPADAWASDPTKLVTNGPYCVGESGTHSMTLVRNERYSDSEDIPETIRIVYAATPEDGWNLYQSGTVDFLAELPESQLQLLAEDPAWEPLALPTTCLLLFNTNQDVLSDPLVRQALHTAIDRTAVSAAVNAACIPAGGLVSSSVPDPDEDAVNFRQHGGDLVNCDPAVLSTDLHAIRQLLEEAGFDTDAPFPTMELLYPDLPQYAAAVQQLAACWAAAFQLEVQLTAMEPSSLDAALASGQYTLALTEYTAPANDAQSFLQGWVTGHPNNVIAYSNTAFDTLLAVIRSASDDNARRGCLHDAESLLLEDVPLTPLYFTGTAYALRDDLTGLLRDARGTFRFTDIQQILLPEEPAASDS